MDNNTSGSRKLFLKPASFQKKTEPNGNSLENTNVFNIGNNPFLKCDEKEEEASKTNETAQETTKEKSTDDLFKPAKNNLNLFTNAKTLSDNSSNFVFGQNLRERVVIDPAAATDTGKKSDDDTNSNSSLLFSSALSTKDEASNDSSLADQQSKDEPKNADKPADESAEGISKTESSTSISTSNNDNSMSLVEAARKYEEMKGAQKRKYEEVEVKTGEEDEKNILEMNCKLFTFDKNNWEERGRGMLRLNDSKTSSRVVFRASGSFRVLLNTKVWRDQLCEQPSSKSLRLTAFDTKGLLKIYLVMGKNEDIENLYHALSTRIQAEKERTPEPEESSEKEPSPEPANKKVATSDE